ncbi:MAG: hypothetical protein ACXAB7_17130 [Candidatus Kariarchaeaceae archaeon]|jgi:hypothetical protein
MKKEDKELTKWGIGLGPVIPSTGFIEVDKLIGSTCNFGITDRRIEFVIEQPEITISSQ